MLGGAIIATLLIFSQLEPLVSKYLWESWGLVTRSKEIEFAEMKNQLQSASKDLAVIKGDAAINKRLDLIEVKLNELSKKNDKQVIEREVK